ncbi:MAG: group II intron maturase-specific domain-containing protein [Lachnotalea sp.]
MKLHRVKTKVICMWDGKEGFDFLGLHHRRMTSETRRGGTFKETFQYPSRKAMKKMKLAIRTNVNSRSLLVANEEDLIKTMNPKIIGWRNYYQTKTDGKWMQALDWYIICTYTRWYNKKHQRRNYLSQVGKVRTIIYDKGLRKMTA